MQPAVFPRQSGVASRLAEILWRYPKLFLLLLLLPPLLWLGIVYLGSLFSLLVQSFFAIDEFSGLIQYEFTLKTYRELLRLANLDIIVRTVTMAICVTLAAAVIAFPIAYYAARYARGRWESAVLSRRDVAAVVELSGESVRLEARVGERGYLELGI